MAANPEATDIRRQARRPRGASASPDAPESSSYQPMQDEEEASPAPPSRQRGSRDRRRRGSPRHSVPTTSNRPIPRDSRGAPPTPSVGRTYNYRGFSTSIGDMFANPQHERVDCCAMTCCGVFQSDRDRYLLQGVAPPSPWKRLWVHLLLPLTLFIMAGYIALHVQDVVLNELLCLAFLGLLLGGLFVQCSKGRSKRMDIRKDVLFYKYQILQHRHDMSIDQILDQTRRPEHDDEDYYFMGQTHRDIGCAHPYCFMMGCYATDRPVAAHQIAADDNPVEASLCSCLYNFFCSPVCGMHTQLCGVCGMAQESREIEQTLLPPAYRRLDYITMQPMLKYFEPIYTQRWRLFHNSDGGEPAVIGPFSEWPQLSQLSKILLQGWIALTIFLGVWSIVGPIFWTNFLQGEGRRHYFGIADFLIYMGTWIANFGLFAIVIYFAVKNRQLELSIDAMIKYFGCGFLLSTTLAVFYELIIGLTLRLMMLCVMAFSGIDIQEGNTYSLEEWTRAPLTLGFGRTSVGISMTAAAGGDDYLPIFGRDHPVAYSIYLFIQAFFLAALIEEICKYFGFRMIEHPDLNFTQRDLEQAARAGLGHQIDEHGGEDDEYSEEEEAGRVVDANAARRGLSSQHHLDFIHHAKSHEAQGAAITVAMICVAIGFSVCEDLMYIFFYNGSSIKMEIYVLLARALFPVHPICAALQSIAVTQRDVERLPTRFGQVILPAVLFHGTFDFVLIWLDFLDALTRQDGYNDTDDEFIEAGPCYYISIVLAVLLVAGTLYWYYKKSKSQRERLASYDADASNNFNRMP